MRKNKLNIDTDLTKIPGIGARMADHLIKAGYPNIVSLKNVSANEIYYKDCLAQGYQVDRCALYQYRLCVAFANNEIKELDKLKWWNWKD